MSIKKYVLPLLFASLNSILAQESLPLRFGAHTYGEGPKTVSDFTCDVFWSSSSSSGLIVTREGSQKQEPISADDPQSLLATETTTWKTSLWAYRQTFDLSGLGLKLDAGIGGAWWNEAKMEKGYFAFAGDAQLMANRTRTEYFLLLLSLGIHERLFFIQADYECWYAPAFYYNIDQSIAIKPLIADQSDRVVDGFGKQMFGHSLNLLVFSFAEAEWTFDMTELDFPYLQLDMVDSVIGFYPISLPSRVTTNKLVGGLRLEIGDSGVLGVKFGKIYMISENLANGFSVLSEDWAWDVTLSFK